MLQPPSYLSCPVYRAVPDGELEDISGGLDAATGLAWSIFASRLYVYSYIDRRTLPGCTVLPFPTSLTATDSGGSIVSSQWIVRIISLPPWRGNRESVVAEPAGSFSFSPPSSGHLYPVVNGHASPPQSNGFLESNSSMCASKQIAVALVHKRSMAVVYWPDITRPEGGGVVVGHAPEEWLNPVGSYRRPSGSFGSRARTNDFVNALVAITPEANITGNNPRRLTTTADQSRPNDVGMMGSLECVLVAGCNSGELWRMDCFPAGITRLKLGREAAAANGMATFGMFAFGGSHNAPATVRGMVVLPVSDGQLSSPSSSASRPAVGEDPTVVPSEEDTSSALTGQQCLLLLTAAGLELWCLNVAAGGGAALAWAYDLLGDKAVQADLPGQKQVQLLDLQ